MRITERKLRRIIRDVILESNLIESQYHEEVIEEGLKDLGLKGGLILSMLGAGLASMAGCQNVESYNQAGVEQPAKIKDPYTACLHDKGEVENHIDQLENDLEEAKEDGRDSTTIRHISDVLKAEKAALTLIDKAINRIAGIKMKPAGL